VRKAVVNDIKTWRQLRWLQSTPSDNADDNDEGKNRIKQVFFHKVSA